MRIPIRYLTVLASLLVTLGGFSSYAMAQIQFSDDFESYTLGPDTSPIGGGWLYYANVFKGFPACDPYLYGYGPGPAPNSNSAFSSIVLGSTGQALNVFSNYDDSQHANGNCIETSLFQEITFSAANAGSYTFMFSAEAPEPLGAGVSTYGFIKLLDPANSYATVYFVSVSTASGGTKSLDVVLDEAKNGMILQWGFSTVASNYLATGRFYDNISFAPEGTVTPPGSKFEGVPIPLWALFVMVGLLAYAGVTRLRSQRES